MSIPASPFKKAFPDLLLLSKGVTVYIEAKAPGEKLTPLQNEFKNQVEEHNGIYLILTATKDGKIFLIYKDICLNYAKVLALFEDN